MRIETFAIRSRSFLQFIIVTAPLKANLGPAFRLSRTTSVTKVCITFEYVSKQVHCVWNRRTGRVSFGGGGGAEVSCLIIFPTAFTKIKWFCPNITWFLPGNGYLKNSRGGGGGLHPPSAPWPVCLWSLEPILFSLILTGRCRSKEMTLSDV